MQVSTQPFGQVVTSVLVDDGDGLRREHLDNMIRMWADPPQPGERRLRADRRDWGPLAEALRANPSRWAMLAYGLAPQLAHEIQAGVLAPFRPAGAFEAVTRQGTIYARYVGGER